MGRLPADPELDGHHGGARPPAARQDDPGPEPRRQQARARRGRGSRLRPGVRSRPSMRWRSATSRTSIASSPSTTRCSAFPSMPARAPSAIRRIAVSSARSREPPRVSAGRPGAGRRTVADEGLMGHGDAGFPATQPARADHDRAPLPAAQLLRAAGLAAVPDGVAPALAVFDRRSRRQPAALAPDRPSPASPAARRRGELRRLPGPAG